MLRLISATIAATSMILYAASLITYQAMTTDIERADVNCSVIEDSYFGDFTTPSCAAAEESIRKLGLAEQDAAWREAADRGLL